MSSTAARSTVPRVRAGKTHKLEDGYTPAAGSLLRVGGTAVRATKFDELYEDAHAIDRRRMRREQRIHKEHLERVARECTFAPDTSKSRSWYKKLVPVRTRAATKAMTVEVNLGTNVILVELTEHDNPKVLAYEFAVTNGLKKAQRMELEALFRRHLHTTLLEAEIDLPYVSDVSFRGRLVEGAQLNALWYYSGGQEGRSRIEWFRVAVGVTIDAVAVGAGPTYTLSRADVGCHIDLAYTPVRADGLEGQQVRVRSAEPVKPLVPNRLYSNHPFNKLHRNYSSQEALALKRREARRAAAAAAEAEAAAESSGGDADDDIGIPTVGGHRTTSVSSMRASSTGDGGGGGSAKAAAKVAATQRHSTGGVAMRAAGDGGGVRKHTRSSLGKVSATELRQKFDRERTAAARKRASMRKRNKSAVARRRSGSPNKAGSPVRRSVTSSPAAGSGEAAAESRTAAVSLSPPTAGGANVDNNNSDDNNDNASGDDGLERNLSDLSALSDDAMSALSDDLSAMPSARAGAGAGADTADGLAVPGDPARQDTARDMAALPSFRRDSATEDTVQEARPGAGSDAATEALVAAAVAEAKSKAAEEAREQQERLDEAARKMQAQHAKLLEMQRKAAEALAAQAAAKEALEARAGEVAEREKSLEGRIEVVLRKQQQLKAHEKELARTGKRVAKEKVTLRNVHSQLVAMENELQASSAASGAGGSADAGVEADLRAARERVQQLEAAMRTDGGGGGGSSSSSAEATEYERRRREKLQAEKAQTMAAINAPTVAPLELSSTGADSEVDRAALEAAYDVALVRKLQAYTRGFLRRCAFRAVVRDAMVSGAMESARNRFKTLQELVSYEVEYNYNLRVLMRDYIIPSLKLPLESAMLQSSELRAVFPASLKDIIKSTNTCMQALSDYMANYPMVQNLGDVLLERVIPAFRDIYTAYANDYEVAREKLKHVRAHNQAYSEFLTRVAREQRIDEIEEFLRQPTTRFEILEMHVEELLGYTPANHAEFRGLEAAAARVAEMKAQMEALFEPYEGREQAQISDIQRLITGAHVPFLYHRDRVFLISGSLAERSVFTDGRVAVYYYFLFNDLMVRTYCKSETNFRFCDEIDLAVAPDGTPRQCVYSEYQEGERAGFLLTVGADVYTFLFEDDNAADWLEVLGASIERR